MLWGERGLKPMWCHLGPGWSPAVEEAGLILVPDQWASLEHRAHVPSIGDDSHHFFLESWRHRVASLPYPWHWQLHWPSRSFTPPHWWVWERSVPAWLCQLGKECNGEVCVAGHRGPAPHRSHPSEPAGCFCWSPRRGPFDLKLSSPHIVG